MASNAGNVILARYLSPYNDDGNIIIINHGQGIITCYLHLSEINIKEGEDVLKGQIIGKVGSTGASTGPHLHWSVYVLGSSTDGLKWVQKCF